MHVLKFKIKSSSHDDLTFGVGERQYPEWPTSPVACDDVLTLEKNSFGLTFWMLYRAEELESTN
jgi:hypothetical protein